MRKMLLISLPMLLALSLAACSKQEKPADKAGTRNPKVHAAAPAAGRVQGFIGVIRDARLDALPNDTIGGAFDGYNYFETRDWNESRGAGGKAVVDFYAKLKDDALSGKDHDSGVVGRGLNVKFIINPDGSYAIASIDRYDNKQGGAVERYPVGDFGAVLPRIYANQVLLF